MYLTKINLDLNKQETAKAFYDRGRFHSLIESGFPGERQHPLWRLEKDGRGCSILLLSRDIPNLVRLENAVGKGDAKTVDYDGYLDFVSENERILQFRASVNPTVCRGGVRVPLNLRRTDRQPYCAEDWLRDRIGNSGAEVLESEVIDNRTVNIKRGKGKVFKVTFEGTLKVTDRDKFRDMLEKGIGHGKAYGCGLLSVMV